MPLVLTPLFSKYDFNGNVELLARTATKIYKIVVTGVIYYFDIGLIPGM